MTVTNFDSEMPVVSATEYLDYDCEREEGGNWKKHMEESKYYDEIDIAYTEANILYISKNSKQLTTDKLNTVLQALCKQEEETYISHIKRKS